MPALPDAFAVIDAWGFKYKTCAFSLLKTKKDGSPLHGMGSYTKSNIEICLLGMRGHIKSVDKTVPQIVMHPRIGHSVKPPVVRDRIVQLFGDKSRLEIFARQKTEGWDAIGYGIDGVSVQEKIREMSGTE
jgi:site-specific DNA-methyltransferase (adenine-specific)